MPIFTEGQGFQNQEEERLENPEDQENFQDENILIMAYPDAHGIAMAVHTAEYLQSKGAKPSIYAGSAFADRQSSTHPHYFFSDTLPNFNLEIYDRVVLCDIPLNVNGLEQSEESIRKTTNEIDDGRRSRGLATHKTNIFYLDHHKSSKFADAWWYDQDAESRVSEVPIDEKTVKDIESYGIQLKITDNAIDCHLGHNESMVSRIGAIADRDPSTLPVTDEEMEIAIGLEIATRPDINDSEPSKPRDGATEEDRQIYVDEHSKWSQRQQGRLDRAVEELQEHNWAYFKAEASQLGSIQVPMSSGFGEVAIIDTSNIDRRLSVPKLMEIALESQGQEKCPYALAVIHDMFDPIIQQKVDAITIIRHWTREDFPTVKGLIASKLGPQFLNKFDVQGPENFIRIYLGSDHEETSRVAGELVEALSGETVPDFRDIRSIMICGDPNSGKSVFSKLLSGALQKLGVHVSLLDLDKAAPTPDWYLQAEIEHREAINLFAKGELTKNQLDEAETIYRDAVDKRQGIKRPWTLDLAEESLGDVRAELANPDVDMVIGDCPGGKPMPNEDGIIERDENNRPKHISRVEGVNAKILEGADAVFIVSNSKAGADEWQRLIKAGSQEETEGHVALSGVVKIHSSKPIRIIGKYHSILDAQAQNIHKPGQIYGLITNLDRQFANDIYNPSIFTTALFISKAVKEKRLSSQAK